MTPKLVVYSKVCSYLVLEAAHALGEPDEKLKETALALEPSLTQALLASAYRGRVTIRGTFWVSSLLPAAATPTTTNSFLHCFATKACFIVLHIFIQSFSYFTSFKKHLDCSPSRHVMRGDFRWHFLFDSLKKNVLLKHIILYELPKGILFEET